MLADEPLVAVARSGPTSFSESFLEWLWQHRFRLAAPEPGDLTVAELSLQLARARDVLSGAEGMVFGDRLLRDPTGSFARLFERLSQTSQDLKQRDGIWQSHDDQAALVFATFVDRPFNVEETSALSNRIRARAVTAGVEPVLLGPRVISAEVSTATARASAQVALIAAALLLLWLVWTLRSLHALFLTFMPLALGAAAASLAVQLIFGSVHVVALGFGGALIGLALDYPLHLLGHAGDARQHAKRLVLLGAITTAVGFLSLLGSGIPALMQTGVFVAVGLAVAAVVSRIIPSNVSFNLRAPPLERLSFRLPRRSWVETGLLLAGLALVIGTSANAQKSLFEPPKSVVASIEKMREMISLPSGRHALLVEGASLAELLAREAAVQQVLDAAVSAKELERYTALSQIFSATATLAAPLSALPSTEVFAQRAEEALRASGMEPSFASTQAEEYRAALRAPAILYQDLLLFPETMPLAARLERTPQGWQELVRLHGPAMPENLAAAIAGQGTPGVRLIDLAGPIETGLIMLRQKVVLWLGIGALAAFGILTVALADWHRALAIARTTGAAVGLTTIFLTLLGGTLGIFQIAALTLVVGIGIDYGLFLNRTEESEARVAHCRSIALCAGSTLIAFSTMAFSSVKLLHEIGLTVTLGVIAMLVLNLATTKPPGSQFR